MNTDKNFWRDIDEVLDLRIKTSRGGLGVERLLQKRRDSAPVVGIPLDAWTNLNGRNLHLL